MRIAILFVLLLPFFSRAQLHEQPDAAKIKLELKKLNSLGAVLYLAAHPDDENTNLIALWASWRKALAQSYSCRMKWDWGWSLKRRSDANSAMRRAA